MRLAVEQRSLERRLLDAIAETVVAADGRGRLIYCNEAAQRAFGATAEELLGGPIEGLLAQEASHDELEAIGEAMLAGRSWTGLVTGQRIDGTTFPHRITLSPLLDDDGALVGMVGVGRDISPEVEAADRARAHDERFVTAIQEQKERLAMTLEAAGMATWDLDLTTLRQTMSDNFADVLGLPFDEVPETFDGILEMVHPDDQALFLEPNPDGEVVADRFDVEFRIIRADGDTIWVGCKGSFVRNDDGEPIGIRGTIVNLTEKRSVEIRRVEAEERYRHTIEAANDAFVGVDDRGHITEWNAAAERMFGWTTAEILGRPVLDTLIPEDRRERYAAALTGWADIVQAGHALPEHWELPALHRDGRVFTIEMSVVTSMDEEVRHLRAFVRDITARKALEQRLAEQAVTDALTGLPDRTVLLDRLSDDLHRLTGSNGVVGVLFIDVDRFKSVNDELGHDAGDQLLVSVADRLRGAVRPADTVARIGGDEFAVVCGDLTSEDDALLVAERILAALDAPLPLGEERYEVRVSIGISLSQDPGTKPDALVRRADMAMYRAKKSGGHRAVVYGT